MKPPFNIPRKHSFFQEGHKKEEDCNEETTSNFKISWFEEQIDTYISRRVVSNYQVYNYQHGVSKDAPKTNTKQPAPQPKEEPSCPDENMINYPDEDTKKDIISKFLDKLFTFNMDKLAGTMSRDIDLRPCEIVTGLQPNNSTSNVEECREKCSKAYYDASEDSVDAGGEVVPLTALETFIKNAMDDSLAKFKEEINKAIDNKFESFRTVPRSSTSLPGTNADGNLLMATLNDLHIKSCLDHSDLEDRIRTSLSADMANAYEYSKDKDCKIFDFIQPEVRNIIFGHDSANFQSESINVIKKNFSESSLLNDPRECFGENSKISDSEKRENYVPSNLSKVLNETSLVDNKVNFDDKHDSSLLMAGESIKGATTECDDSSENCIAEAYKKGANPKVMADITKFMYIFFESYKRLKEENLKRELESCSGIESVNSSCGSKLCDESLVPKDAMKSSLDQTPVDKSKVKELDIEKSESIPSPNIPLENTREESSRRIINQFIGKLSRDDRPIISMTGELGDEVENFKSEAVNTSFIQNQSDLLQFVDNEDSGYTVQKFKKNNLGYKPTASSKMLENLKELYLQNLNNMEQKKSVASGECRDKYECHIKKKFSPGENCSRIGTRLDSKFYCNVRSKMSENRKVSGSMRLARIRSKGSSNIISVRHSLIKSRNRSAFKNITKKREISLDSTVISLLDISLKNRSSWIRKLSELSSTSSEEEKNEEKMNLLKRLCFITFAWGKRQKHFTQQMDQHLSNIYNAICLDFVTDDVYKSVLFVSGQLRSGSQKNKDEIMRRWEKICNKPLEKEKKTFNLESLHQIWVQFRTKIFHLARPPPIVPPNFFPALTFPSEENRLIKEQVIQKYARDILEYISDPKLYKHTVSLYSCSSLNL